MKPSVAILQVHPAPYRDPIFKKLCERSLLDIQVFTMSEVDVGHSYRPQIALDYPNRSLGQAIDCKYIGSFNPKIFREISRRKFDVYLSHDGSITGMIVMGYAWAHKRPLIFSGDPVLYQKIAKSPFAKIREWSVRKMLSYTDAAWIPGQASQEFLEYYGVPEERIFQGAYCLDLDQILQFSEPARKRRESIRARMGIAAADWLFLFVGRMFPFRGVKYLVEAFQFLRLKRDKVKLLLIGDGPERAGLEAQCQQAGLADIIFLDPVPLEQLTEYYVAADSYVTAGLRENYSLALAQAAVCALPIISTDRVGAVKDYLREGKTGFLVPAGDSLALAAAMIRLVSSRDLAAKMGETAGLLAQQRTVTWAAEQLEAAVLQSLDFSRKQKSP